MIYEQTVRPKPKGATRRPRLEVCGNIRSGTVLGTTGGTMRKTTRGGVIAVTLGLALVAAAVAPSAALRASAARGDRAFYILPPGNYGGLPTTANSLDQLPLYDSLTPLRGNVTDADITRSFLPENFKPVGATHVEVTGHPGTTIVYDAYGVPHITGRTRADLAFGTGWVTARDRGLLLQLGRGPARVAVADIPGIDAFGLVTSGQSFVPSAQTEQLVTNQQKLLVTTYGAKGRAVIADAQAEADGINAYFKAHHVKQPPATVNDVIAVTAFIGSIFGAGGGAEASNAEFLSELENHLGATKGRQAWQDAMLLDDPEAPTTITQPFNYGPTGGPVTGSVTIDEGSIQSLDPTKPLFAAHPATSSATTLGTPPYTDPTYPAAGPVPHKLMSNFLVVNPARSATGNTLAVMGPQLGYYYPEIVEQEQLTGPGIQAQGVAVPGLSMYMLIGRTTNYAWSLTSAVNDVRDVFAEVLCNPDGTPATRQSTHYLYKGVCRPFNIFHAGLLNGKPVVYPTSVHGPVIGTALSNGKPIALSRERSTFGRDGLNLVALHDMTEGDATTPSKFFDIANEFGFTFNWAYASRSATAFFSSGLLPRRAPGLDWRLPTLGSGAYEWRGFLTGNQHPHDVTGPNGLLLNWNNRSAPDFTQGDDYWLGSVHRVEMFNNFAPKVTLAGDASVMNRAATQDERSLVWPVVSQVLHTGPAPNDLDATTLGLLDKWVQDDAPRLDADNNGFYDSPGPAIMDTLWPKIADAVMGPVYGSLITDLDAIRPLDSDAGESYVDKDLRTLLGDPVKGPFNLHYCGAGSLTDCRASLWTALDETAISLSATYGPDPNTWLGPASRTGFTPGLIPQTMRTTNRPTFQQVIELQNSGAAH